MDMLTIITQSATGPLDKTWKRCDWKKALTIQISILD